MAKRRYTPSGRSDSSGQTLGDFAEDLGRFLGSTQARAQSWMKQQQAIATQLVTVRDTASRLLHELGETAAGGTRRGRGRRARKLLKNARAAATKGVKRARTFTRAQRLAQSRRMKAYWAQVRKARKTKRTKRR